MEIRGRGRRVRLGSEPWDAGQLDVVRAWRGWVAGRLMSLAWCLRTRGAWCVARRFGAFCWFSWAAVVRAASVAGPTSVPWRCGGDEFAPRPCYERGWVGLLAAAGGDWRRRAAVNLLSPWLFGPLCGAAADCSAGRWWLVSGVAKDLLLLLGDQTSGSCWLAWHG